MPAKPVKAKEQYRLVMECRSSGLTDHQWRREKGICPGTFYGWVRRLRQKGYQDIPEPVHSQRISCSASVLPFLAFSIFINIFIISFDEADILS